MKDPPVTLAERVRSLAHPSDYYPREGSTGPIDAAREIEGNMSYLGMDDAIIEMAEEVRDRDETAMTIERLAGEGYSVQVEFWWGAIEEVAWHCNLWEGRMGDTVRPYRENEDIILPYGIVGAGKGSTVLEAVLKAEGSAKDTMTQQSVGMPGPGEPT